MATHISHASTPYPVKNARFTVIVPFLDADGDPTDPTTPDTEVSQDGGAFADAAEEVTTISGTNGMGYITLTGAETNNSAVGVAVKVASGPKATLMMLYPRNLVVVSSGTLAAGSAGGGTLAAAPGYDFCGCFLRTTGGTGGGGTGGANNQVRKIVTCTPSTGAFTVSPNWETTPSTDTTYDVLLPDGVTLGMLKALNPTTAGRTLDVSSGGEAGVDWANVGSPTTTLGLSGTTVKTATDVEAKLPTALVSGRIDASVGAMAANVLTATAINADAITAAKIADGAIDAATFAANAITATVIESDAITAAKVAADVTTEITAPVLAVLGALADAAADGDPTSSDTVMMYVKQLVNTLVGTTGIVSFPTSADAANGVSLAEVIRKIQEYIDTEIAAIKAKTDQLTFTVSNQVDSHILSLALGVLTANKFDADVFNAIEDAVLDASETDHITLGTIGGSFWFNGFLLRTTVDTVTDNQQFTLVTGDTDSATYTQGSLVLVQDAGNSLARTVGVLASYDGGTKEVTLRAALSGFTVAPGDFVTIIAAHNPQPILDAVGNVAPGVWEEALGDHEDPDTFGGLVNAMVDLVTAAGEPGQGAPPVSATPVEKMSYLYKFLRNKVTQDATTLSVFADDGSTVDHKATVSDDLTTYVRGEIVSGP